MLTYLRRVLPVCLIALQATLILSSCSKNEFNGPILVNDPVNNKRTFTLEKGQTTTLTSKFESPESLSYEWSIDGQKIANASSSSYTFSSAEPGSYIITQRIFNGNGEVYIDYYVVVKGGYDKGTFLFNNNGTASISFVNSDFSSSETNAYAKANPGKSLGKSVLSAQPYNGKIYIVTEDQGLVVVNSITLKEVARIPSLPAKPNYFLCVDRSIALLSTDEGIYKVNLSPLALGEKIVGIGGRVGKMAITSSYVFALTLENGVVAIDKNKLTISRILRVGKAGLTTDISENVWTTNRDTLFAITNSLSVTKNRVINGPYATASWNPWNEGTLCTSTAENELFFIKANDDGRPSREIYKVTINSLSNLSIKLFGTIPEGRSFSGVGIRISSENNIVASTVSSTTGADPAILVYPAAGSGDAPKYALSVEGKNPSAILFNNIK